MLHAVINSTCSCQGQNLNNRKYVKTNMPFMFYCVFFVRMFLLLFFHFFLGGGGPIAIKIKMTSLNMTIIIVMKRRFNFQKNVQLKLILYDIRKAVPKVIETLI